MNKNFKVQAQGGFTLIELIVVIVILGILAATALPKFASLSGDARLASVNAAKGSMASAASISHGKLLVTPSALDTTTNKMKLEGTDVEMVNGYPAATAGGILVAAGIDTSDYTVFLSGSTATIKPSTIPAGGLALVPASIATSAQAANCYVTYTPATKTNGVVTAPVIGMPSTATTANCE
jgi:MSHA pilin protein MshA